MGPIMKILIVDDQATIIKMVARRLKRFGYEIHSAPNGKIGVEKALELQPKLILMDMHMPIMDGYEAVKTLRHQEYNGFIIALTASAMATDTHKSIEVGCNQVITKPIDRHFEDTIQSVLKEINSKIVPND